MEEWRYYDDVNGVVRHIWADSRLIGMLDLESGRAEISPDDPDYCIRDNVIYSKDMTELVYILSRKEPDDWCFEVPAGVKRIKRRAGSSLKGLCRLVVPESVTVIEEGAFVGCPDLIEADIHAKTLEDHAFFNCGSLTAVRLDCRTIGKNAFFNCKKLSAIELLNTEVICCGAFGSCDSLKDVRLPDTLQKLGYYSFYATGIKLLTVPKGVLEVGADILSHREPKKLTPELCIYMKDGAVPFDPGIRPVGRGALLSVRCAETDELLFKFAVIGCVGKVFTPHGVDFTEYDKKLVNSRRYGLPRRSAALYSVLARLSWPVGLSGEIRRAFLSCALEKAEPILLSKIRDPETPMEKLAEHPYYDFMNRDGMLRLIDESARAGKTEVTAMLMQRLRDGQFGQLTEQEELLWD